MTVACLAKPTRAGQLLDPLFGRGLDPLDVILAMNETTAHLVFLEQRGAVRKDLGDDGAIRYVVACGPAGRALRAGGEEKPGLAGC